MFIKPFIVLFLFFLLSESAQLSINEYNKLKNKEGVGSGFMIDSKELEDSLLDGDDQEYDYDKENRKDDLDDDNDDDHDVDDEYNSYSSGYVETFGNNPKIEVKTDSPVGHVKDPFTDKVDVDDDEEDLTFDANENEKNSKSHIPPVMKEIHEDRYAPLSLTHPAVLAVIISGIILLIFLVILAIVLITYRMRKKDEGSYALDENMSKKSRQLIYTKLLHPDEYYA